VAYTSTSAAPRYRAPTAKNRVRKIFSYPVNPCPANRRQSPQPRREIRPVPTKPVSGIPYWPSRDLIEEKGGLNLYGFLGNDGVSGVDFLGNVIYIYRHPELVQGRPCSSCCKKCEKKGEPKIEDDGTKGTNVKAKITSIQFESSYLKDTCSAENGCGDCCAVYYRWWTCYDKRCQQNNGGPKLNIS